MVSTRHCDMLRFPVCINEGAFREIVAMIPGLHVQRFELCCNNNGGQFAAIQRLEGNLLDALSRNGDWFEVVNDQMSLNPFEVPGDFFSEVGRAKLQRLASRNRDLQAWAADPSSCESAWWPEALSVAAMTGPSLVFEFLVNSGATITAASP